MLDPRNRKLFVESLKPPADYELDTALGTTYSLDLAALINVPLAITLNAHLSEEDREPDPLAPLASVRRCADKVSVFCQAGQIYVPKSERTLFSYLEKSVFEVLPPKGVFHPKLWFLRFTAADVPVFYRVLIASRNLTFDRSWDTLLVLEGKLVDRQNAFARNHPLADFAAALPGLALRTVPGRVRRSVKLVSDELRRVDFELPEGIKDIKFWPLGLPGHSRDPFQGRIDRLLIVSPFASNETLRELSTKGRDNILVSRLETLSHLEPEVLSRFKRVLVMADNSVAEPNEEEAAAEEESEVGLAPDVETDVPNGLHAKVYVADEGWGARLWTGSPNATAPAFGGNVEFLAELIGGKYTCGVSHVLGDESKGTGLWGLLEEFTPGDCAEPATEEMRLAVRLDRVRKLIAASKPVAEVVQIEDTDSYRLTVRASAGKLRKALSKGVEASCRPIAVADSMSVPLSVPRGAGSVAVAEFPSLSFAALTSFFAFSVTARSGKIEKTDHFVLNVPVEGLPADREERLMLAILENRQQVMRYLLMLLFANDEQLASSLIQAWDGEGQGDVADVLELPLFESLVRALYRDPAQLDSVAQLVEDLRKTERGRKLLPEGFAKVWEPVQKARAQL